MTKTLISVVVIVLVLWGAYGLFKYWERLDNEKADSRRQAASSVVVPEHLAGLPNQLETSLRGAQAQGPEAFGQWLKTYNRNLADPRKAWIELDYCVMIARKDPQEARRVFANVKQRTPPNSPVAPRVRDLTRTFE
jgi:hypothetical protein